jgi:hypothetical protein
MEYLNIPISANGGDSCDFYQNFLNKLTFEFCKAKQKLFLLTQKIGTDELTQAEIDCLGKVGLLPGSAKPDLFECGSGIPMQIYCDEDGVAVTGECEANLSNLFDSKDYFEGTMQEWFCPEEPFLIMDKFGCERKGPILKGDGQILRTRCIFV